MNTLEDIEAKYRSRLVRAAAALQELEARLERMRKERTEPIAVIGMGCRFPGDARDPEAFWRLIRDGVDAVSEVPAHRRHAGSAVSAAGRWGAFLSDVEGFDAAFFGISPREACQLDPQHRLLLEVAWEALEHAGLIPQRLAGTTTGVFLGMSTNDYLLLGASAGAKARDAHAGTGTAHAFGPGRLSYFLGLRGPSMTVDTACSSSLVAVHLAMQSLRNGESSLALAGGVNLILDPSTTEMVADLQALSPDGRCRSFEARANGFVRGEGCGLVVLKRLSDAQANGDRVLALLRGSAVNADGHSAGLTAPSVIAQQEMLRQALTNARVAATDIDYVETHGTGTALGDPIEAEALIEVLGAPRPGDAPCVLGALKTNIGHLEAAAGIAGLLKVVQALRHESIPGNLHFTTLNPRISLQGTPFVLPTKPVPWPVRSDARPRLAGVSSFGMSGTNAHVIVEEAPREDATPEEPAVVLVPISARTAPGLRELAGAYPAFLEPKGPGLRAMAYTAAIRRQHHEHRAAFVVSSCEQFARWADAFARGETPPGVVAGQATDAGALTFVFSGQGAQWIGMGRELLASQPVFAAALAECDAHAPFSLTRELQEPTNERDARTEIVQPVLFGVQIALVALLSSWGIEPGAVIGHSAGEVAAACVAGALSLPDAMRLAVVRGRIMQRAAGSGRMVSIATSPEQAMRALGDLPEKVSIAAINDGGSIVLSGPERELDAIVERLGARAKKLDGHYAFHSPIMDPLADELGRELAGLVPKAPTRAMYSTVTGARLTGTELTAAYWADNVRRPVRFAHAVHAAIDAGARDFLELGPHPVLSGNLRQCLADKSAQGHVVPTLRRNEPELPQMLRALAALYTRGHAVDFRKLHPTPQPVVTLPTYPWQRKPYWFDRAPDVDPMRANDGRWVDRLRALPAHEREAEIERAVRIDIATVLQLASPDEIPTDRPLMDLGVDSLMAVQVRHELSARTGEALPATVAFDHPTPKALARYLLERLTPEEERTTMR
ncbi:acyltransferase domain-containing protein [Pendulispora rubella]|uniref:Acyltransferase domain-containing protein n=1 Tax=Pendulispora rubella TaxID=2741070 RepID=A0ABZ2LBN7_9BACT